MLCNAFFALTLLVSIFFFSSEFSSSEFSLSELEEISVLSIIYLGIFHSLTIYLHSSLHCTHSKNRINQNH